MCTCSIGVKWECAIIIFFGSRFQFRETKTSSRIMCFRSEIRVGAVRYRNFYRMLVFIYFFADIIMQIIILDVGEVGVFSFYNFLILH